MFVVLADESCSVIICDRWPEEASEGFYLDGGIGWNFNSQFKADSAVYLTLSLQHSHLCPSILPFSHFTSNLH